VPGGETVLALDFGLRHIGVAVGNTFSRTAQPLTIIKAKDGVPDWTALSSLAEEWRPDRIVVGLPINMDGSSSELSERASKFARQVEGRIGVVVSLVDERLSSREAKRSALAEGHRGDFAAEPIDDQAAAIILSTWLNEL
jgi:putative Holliday junction resolvase